jgi:hypothetical protein
LGVALLYYILRIYVEGGRQGSRAIYHAVASKTKSKGACISCVWGNTTWITIVGVVEHGAKRSVRSELPAYRALNRALIRLGKCHKDDVLGLAAAAERSACQRTASLAVSVISKCTLDILTELIVSTYV